MPEAAQVSPETQTVPVISGRVQVLAAVKSAGVIVPPKPAVVTVDCGLIEIESDPEVVEAKEAELDVVRVVENAPDDWVYPVTADRAPEAMTRLLIVFVVPAAVIAPAWETLKLVEVIKFEPNVPAKLMPFDRLLPFTFRPSVTVTWLPVAVSLFARLRIESTAVSVEAESFCLILMAAAVSLLPATDVFWVNSRSSPAIVPVVTAVVPWLLVMLNFSVLQAVLAAEFAVDVKLAKEPVVIPVLVKANVSAVVAAGLNVKLALPVMFESDVK